MLRLLVRKGLRQLLAARIRAGALCLLVAAGAGITAGLGATADVLDRHMARLAATLDAADLDVDLQPMAEAQLPARMAGARAIEARLVVRGVLELSGGGRLPALVVHRGQAQLDRLQVLAGEPPAPGDRAGVVVERSLLTEHGVRPGDRLVLDPDTAPRRLVVRAVAMSPEFLLPTANPEHVAPPKGSLAVLWLPPEAADPALLGLVNQLAVGLEPGARTEDVPGQLAALPLGPEGIRRRTDRFDRRFISDDLRAIRLLAAGSGSLFLLLTALFAADLVRGLLRPWREEWSLLASLGIGRTSVALAALAQVSLLAVAAAFVSLPVPSIVCGTVSRAYADAIGLIRPPSGPAAMGATILGAMLAAATCLVAALFALVPAERGRPPGRWSRRLGAFSGSWRLALRALMRRPRATVVEASLLAAAMALPVAFGSFSQSWQAWARASFDREPWDAWVTLRAPVDDAALAVSGVEVLPVSQGSARLLAAGVPPFDARLWGVPAGTRGVQPGGVVLPARVARAHDLAVGSRLSLEHGPRRIELTVTGLARDLAFDTLYLERRDAAHLLGTSRFSAALVTVSGGEALERLRRHELVATVAARTELADRVAEYLRDVGRLATLATPVAVLFAMLLTGAAVRSALAQRGHELGWLTLLGFSPAEIRHTLAAELAMKLLLALALVLPLARAAAVVLDRALSQVFFSVPLVIAPAQVWPPVAAVLAVCGLAALVTLQFRRGALVRVLMPALSLLVLAAVGAPAARAQADGAAALVRRAREMLAFGATGLRAVVRMESRRGERILVRRVEVLAAADGSAVRLTVLDPADLRGTKLLIERRGSEVRRALYLPELRRVRPLGQGRAAEPFLGTDLRFADLELLDDALYQFRQQGEVQEGNHNLVRLVGEARSKEAGYRSVELLVERATGVPWRIRAGTAADRHELEVVRVEGTPPRVQQARVGATTITVEKAQRESPDSSEFTSAALESR